MGQRSAGGSALKGHDFYFDFRAAAVHHPGCVSVRSPEGPCAQQAKFKTEAFEKGNGCGRRVVVACAAIALGREAPA
jgi:hypothetical protein